ncbi:hypothetical protein MHYP_G00214540 [Metynnis hypsauchen]
MAFVGPSSLSSVPSGTAEDSPHVQSVLRGKEIAEKENDAHSHRREHEAGGQTRPGEWSLEPCGGESVCDVLWTDPKGPQLQADPWGPPGRRLEPDADALLQAEKDGPPSSAVAPVEKCLLCIQQMWPKFVVRKDLIYTLHYCSPLTTSKSVSPADGPADCTVMVCDLSGALVSACHVSSSVSFRVCMACKCFQPLATRCGADFGQSLHSPPAWVKAS